MNNSSSEDLVYAISLRFSSIHYFMQSWSFNYVIAIVQKIIITTLKLPNFFYGNAIRPMY